MYHLQQGLGAPRLFGILGAEGSVGLEADGIDADEAVGVSRVVVKGITAAFNVHGSKVGVVESLGAGASLDNHVTLVELEHDNTFNVTLGKLERVADQFHLWCEPKAIVAETGEFSGQSLCDALDFTVHSDALQVHVGGAENGATRGLVDATTLDPNETVLDNVDAANSVLASNLVAVKEEIQGVGNDGSVSDVGDLGGNTLEELDLDSLAGVRGGLRRNSHLEHVLIGRAHGILEITALVRSVEQVLVDGVVGLGLGVNGNAVLGAVGEQVLASLERLNELGITPRSNALDGGGKGLAAHFEANLVVSLSSGSVTNVSASFLIGDTNHFLGDARASDGSSEEVASLVDSVGLDGFEDVVIDVVLAEISDDALDGTGVDGLGLDSRKVFFELAHIGTKGDNVKALFAEPLEDHGRIKASAVCEEELGLGFGHLDLVCWG